MDSFPVIRLEVEGMKHTILHAFSQLHLQSGEYVKKALDEFCSKPKLQRVVVEAVEKEIIEAVRTEIEDFFKYGEGRAVVDKAIVDKLRASL